MPISDDVQNAFDESWRARRALARAEEDMRMAEMLFEQRRAEHQEASDAMRRADERLQALACKAAGVEPKPDDSAVMALPRRAGDGFRPIRR